MKRTIAPLYRAGASVIVGTDTPWPYLVPGFSLHDELLMLGESGLTPTEALTAATLEASRRLEVDHLTGTLDEGKAADLLVVEGDPTSEISHIGRVREVFGAGRRVDVAGLQPGLFQPDDPINRVLITYVEAHAQLT